MVSQAEWQQITHSVAKKSVKVEHLWWSIQAVEAVTLSWHFSWVVD